MFYIYANGESIYQPMDDTLCLISPKLTLEMGKAGSLQFSIPPGNKYYNALEQLKTIVTVEMDDVEIFRGRVLTNMRNFNNIRSIYCEGDLAYLVDSVQKRDKYNGKAHDLFRKIIASHNARVEPAKQFTVGEITVENRDVAISGQSDDVKKTDNETETERFDYKQIAINSTTDEWQTSFNYIETCLINYIGGYLRTRYIDGITYIDYLKDYDSTAVQEIEFGKNMLDLTEEVSAEDVFTVLIPLGDENLTIADVNNGSDELVDAEAVARYGRILKTHVFDSVNTPETLLENGRRFLASNVNIPVTITVKAVDMHLVDPNTSGIFLGDKVHVNSAPHGLVEYLTCTRIEYDMSNPANNVYTFGTPRQSLTERYRKDKAKSEGGGGGASGGAGEASETAAEEAAKELKEVFDAWINCNPEAGHISLGALYEKYQNDKNVLKNDVGIDLDAPSGQVNIKNLRKEFDDLGNVVKSHAASINTLTTNTGAMIEQLVGSYDDLGKLKGNYASLVLRLENGESAINAKADTVTVESIKTTLTAIDKKLTETQDVLTKQCGIVLDASDENPNVNISTLKKTVDAHGTTIGEHTTSINSISTSLESVVAFEAKYKSDIENIASIKATADANESNIRLKANKTYVDSEILTVAGRIEAAEGKIQTLEADLADVETLISDRINSYFTDTVVLKAGQIGVTSHIRAGGTITGTRINAISSMMIDNQYVATQKWVDEQGYLKELSSDVATNAEVTSQLANYATRSFVIDNYVTSTDMATTLSGLQTDFYTTNLSATTFNLTDTHVYWKAKTVVTGMTTDSGTIQNTPVIRNVHYDTETIHYLGY